MKNILKSGAKRIAFFASTALIMAMSVVQPAAAQGLQQRELLRASLSAFSQVPSVLAKSSGNFEAVVNADGTISFALTYTDMSSAVVQAHIHLGSSRTNGGVMVFLCGGAKPACPASGTVTGTLTAADVSTLPASNGDSVIPQGLQPSDLAGMIEAIRSGNTYVNVHTTNFPNGELRGQVTIR